MARAGRGVACGEHRAARKSEKKKDVGADSGGVVEDCPLPRLLTYEDFSLAALGVEDWYGAARDGEPARGRLAIAVVDRTANG